MDLRNKVTVITGGANGIGAALARRFAAEGARAVVVVDLDQTRAEALANEVRTNMLAGTEDGGVAGVDGVIEPEQVAQAVVQGLADERFLILPHPQVAEYVRRKATDYDRWLGGMRRLQRRFQDGIPRS